MRKRNPTMTKRMLPGSMLLSLILLAIGIWSWAAFGSADPGSAEFMITPAKNAIRDDESPCSLQGCGASQYQMCPCTNGENNPGGCSHIRMDCTPEGEPCVLACGITPCYGEICCCYKIVGEWEPEIPGPTEPVTISGKLGWLVIEDSGALRSGDILRSGGNTPAGELVTAPLSQLQLTMKRYHPAWTGPIGFTVYRGSDAFEITGTVEQFTGLKIAEGMLISNENPQEMLEYIGTAVGDFVVLGGSPKGFTSDGTAAHKPGPLLKTVGVGGFGVWFPVRGYKLR